MPVDKGNSSCYPRISRVSRHAAPYHIIPSPCVSRVAPQTCRFDNARTPLSVFYHLKIVQKEGTGDGGTGRRSFSKNNQPLARSKKYSFICVHTGKRVCTLAHCRYMGGVCFVKYLVFGFGKGGNIVERRKKKKKTNSRIQTAHRFRRK